MLISISSRGGSGTHVGTNIDLFVTTANDSQPLTAVTKNFILDATDVLDPPLSRLQSEAVARRCSVRKGVLRNFAKKFTEKHLCQSLVFNKVAGFRLPTLLKKKLWHRYFPVNFVKFLRTRFFTEYLAVAASVQYD